MGKYIFIQWLQTAFLVTGHTFQMREHSLRQQNWLEILAGGTFLVYEVIIFLCLWSFKFSSRKEATKLSIGALIRDRTQGLNWNVWLVPGHRPWTLEPPSGDPVTDKQRRNNCTPGTSYEMDASSPTNSLESLGKNDPISADSEEAFLKKVWFM